MSVVRATSPAWRETMPLASRSDCLRWSDSACPSCAFAAATWACALAWLARAAPRPARSALSSRRASTWPFSTWSPSSISTCVRVPVIWVETVARRRGVT